MGFPTLVTPAHCSETLREWIGKLTQGDCEKLRLWGIPTKLLKAADVEVSPPSFVCRRKVLETGTPRLSLWQN